MYYKIIICYFRIKFAIENKIIAVTDNIAPSKNNTTEPSIIP